MNDEKELKVIEFIKSNPDRLNQNWWTNIAPGYMTTHPIRDGFNGCMAGITSFLFAPEGTKFYNATLILPDGRETQYANFAAYELDLTPCEEETLFYSLDNAEEVIAFLKKDAEDRDKAIVHKLTCQKNPVA